MSKLFEALIFATATAEYQWTDAILQIGLPMVLRTPAANIQASEPITTEELDDLIATVWRMTHPHDDREGWREALKHDGLKEAIDLDLIQEQIHTSQHGSEDAGTATQPDQEHRPVRLRFMIVRASGGNGYTAVIRQVPQSIPSLSKLAILSSNKSAAGGRGLVLVTGPTKNGKSTVVASFIEELRVSGKAGHIVVIADPIEHVHPSTKGCVVTSREIGVDVTTYVKGVEEAQRLAPDVIVIGEILDASTARAALVAGESGHLVFATLQATTVEGALAKLATLTADQPGSKETIAACVKVVIRTALVPSREGNHFVFASESIQSTGRIAELIADGNTVAGREIRNILRAKTYSQHAESLNDSLRSLVAGNVITPEAAKAASNDLQDWGKTDR